MTTPTPDPSAESGPELGPEEIERVRERLAAPAPPEGVFERSRAAALQAFDEVHGASTSSASVRDIGDARQPDTLRAWHQRIPLGAAAAVVAVVAAVGVFSQVDFGGEDADTASADLGTAGDFDDSGMDRADGEVRAPTEESAILDSAGSGGGGSGALGGGDMGADGSGTVLSAYADVEALVEDFRERYSAVGDASDTPAPTAEESTAHRSSTCDAVTAAEVDPDRVAAQEFVTLGLDGDRSTAIVVVYESDDTGWRVAVVDDGSCALRDDRAL